MAAGRELAVLATSAALAYVILYMSRHRRAPKGRAAPEREVRRPRSRSPSRDNSLSPVATRGERTHSMEGADRTPARDETRGERSHSLIGGDSSPYAPPHADEHVEKPEAAESRGVSRRRSNSDLAIVPTTF